MLPETKMVAAQRVAERLRRQVEASDFSVAANAISTTISIGIAEANPAMNDIFRCAYSSYSGYSAADQIASKCR